jgi:hypothetical protein
MNDEWCDATGDQLKKLPLVNKEKIQPSTRKKKLRNLHAQQSLLH